MTRTLKEHRTQKRLSQHELSEKSGVSIRTIQRIENNLSAGSPYVVKSLCKALDISIDALEILNDRDNRDNSAGDDISDITIPNAHLKYINFGAFTLLIFPFSNLISTSVLYWAFRKTLTRTPERQTALKIISFQILWSALTLAMIIFIPALINLLFGISELLDIPVFLWIYLTLVLVHMIITFDTAIALNKGRAILAYVPNIL